MLKSTSEITNDYIHNHPHIKHCLKKGIINYSALARLISQELNIKKSSSNEAILIAARRLEEKLKKEIINENKIAKLLKNSELEIKNKISVIILNKPVDFQDLQKAEIKIKQQGSLFYKIEGSSSYTIITQSKFIKDIQIISKTLLQQSNNLSLITLHSDEQIEKIPGVMSFITSLFAEHNINIIEFMSCWKDTLFIINTKDVKDVMNFLHF